MSGRQPGPSREQGLRRAGLITAALAATGLVGAGAVAIAAHADTTTTSTTNTTTTTTSTSPTVSDGSGSVPQVQSGGS